MSNFFLASFAPQALVTLFEDLDFVTATNALVHVKTLQNTPEGIVELVSLPRDLILGTASPSGRLDTPQLVVRKSYRKSTMNRLQMNNVRRECELHSKLQHPCIVDLYACWETANEVILLQEYMDGGDLFGELYEKPRAGPLGIAERRTCQLIKPIAEALAFLHGRNIVHRDLKLENIFITKTGVVKLGDLGFVISAQSERPMTRLGTLISMSPEVLRAGRAPPGKEQAAYGPEVDIWALGVTVYELLMRKAPFNGNTFAELMAATEKEVRLPATLSPEANDFVQRCLMRNAADRATAASLLEHPWMAKAIITGRPAHPEATSTLRKDKDNKLVGSPAPVATSGRASSGFLGGGGGTPLQPLTSPNGLQASQPVRIAPPAHVPAAATMNIASGKRTPLAGAEGGESSPFYKSSPKSLAVMFPGPSARDESDMADRIRAEMAAANGSARAGPEVNLNLSSRFATIMAAGAAKNFRFESAAALESLPPRGMLDGAPRSSAPAGEVFRNFDSSHHHTSASGFGSLHGAPPPRTPTGLGAATTMTPGRVQMNRMSMLLKQKSLAANSTDDAALAPPHAYTGAYSPSSNGFSSSSNNSNHSLNALRRHFGPPMASRNALSSHGAGGRDARASDSVDSMTGPKSGGPYRVQTHSSTGGAASRFA